MKLTLTATPTLITCDKGEKVAEERVEEEEEEYPPNDDGSENADGVSE